MRNACLIKGDTSASGRPLEKKKMLQFAILPKLFVFYFIISYLHPIVLKIIVYFLINSSFHPPYSFCVGVRYIETKRLV